MSGIGKVVWLLQWPALVATPAWWVAGSTITGGGWGTLLALLLAIPTFVVMLIGPIIGVASRRLRASRAMPGGYSIITVVQWLLGLVWPLTIRTEGDISTGASALGAIGLSERLVGVLSGVSIAGFWIALIAGVIVLIVNVVSAGRAGPVAPGASPIGSVSP